MNAVAQSTRQPGGHNMSGICRLWRSHSLRRYGSGGVPLGQDFAVSNEAWADAIMRPADPDQMRPAVTRSIAIGSGALNIRWRSIHPAGCLFPGKSAQFVPSSGHAQPVLSESSSQCHSVKTPPERRRSFRRRAGHTSVDRDGLPDHHHIWIWNNV